MVDARAVNLQRSALALLGGGDEADHKASHVEDAERDALCEWGRAVRQHRQAWGAAIGMRVRREHSVAEKG